MKWVTDIDNKGKVRLWRSFREIGKAMAFWVLEALECTSQQQRKTLLFGT
jgi:hypothetical protein